MRRTPPGPRPYARPRASRSKPSLLISLTGPKKIGMRCSASSTAICQPKEVRHETLLRKPPSRGSVGHRLVPDGLFLVRVERARYRWHAQKPYYLIGFTVLEPKYLAACLITGRLYCTAKALWKLSWFLRDFGYDTELLGKDEIDDQALVGLQGVLKISHAIVHGISLLNLDGFAPLSRWKELSPTAADDPPGSEVAS